MKIKFAALILVVALSLSACIPSALTPTLIAEPIFTQAAQTVAAQLTLSAGATAVTLLTEIAAVPPTASPPPPSATPIPPTATPQPTETPLPTDTPLPPTETLTPDLPCLWARVVSDRSEPDVQYFYPGEEFTKIWRIQNIGTCTWDQDFSMIFDRGTEMGGPSSIPLDVVRPGETVDVAVDLTVSLRPGDYASYWMLSSSWGELFGIGQNAASPIRVQVKVGQPFQSILDFAENYCMAEWTSSYGQLICPDLNANRETGFVNRYPNPSLEKGSNNGLPALVTFPSQGEGGYISGRFPSQKIKSSDHFKTVVGCLEGKTKCNVTFRLSYSVNGGKVKDLGSWTEVYDNKVSHLDVDLSFLAGKDVELILTVLNNGSNEGDWAFWLAPTIWR